MAGIERLEFDDEHGQHWVGWRSDEGRIDVSAGGTTPDGGLREANPYAGMFAAGDYEIRRREG